MIEVHYRCALGNNLFQYALGRILAEHRGDALLCSAATKHTDAGQQSLPDVVDAFVDLPQKLPGRRVEEPQNRFVVGDRLTWNWHGLDLDALLSDPEPTRIVLDGFFQVADYYAPHRLALRRWFTLKPRDLPFPADNDVAIHVRRGDFWMLGSVLSSTWYRDRLAELDPARVFVFGVDVDDDVRAALSPWDTVYVDGSPMDDFALLQRFQRIVLSDSTFSWWAAFLSDAEVWHPTPERGLWSLEAGRAQLVVDAPRWHEVKAVPCTIWRPFVPASVTDHALADRTEFNALNTWLVRQEEPFGLEEALAHRRGTPRRTIEKYLKQLVRAGALAVSARDARLLKKKGL